MNHQGTKLLNISGKIFVLLLSRLLVMCGSRMRSKPNQIYARRGCANLISMLGEEYPFKFGQAAIKCFNAGIPEKSIKLLK